MSFRKSLDVILQPSKHPTIRFSDFNINLSEVFDLLSKNKTGSLSSDPILTFHIQNKLVAARKAYQFLKRTVPYRVSPSTKHMYYRLGVQSVSQYGSPVCYPSINYTRKLELFNKECLFWVTGSQNYSHQLAASNTLPISYYLVRYAMVFLNEAKNKHHLNLSTYISFSKPSKDLRSSKHQQLSPVKRCRNLSKRVLSKSLWLLQLPRYKRN